MHHLYYNYTSQKMMSIFLVDNETGRMRSTFVKYLVTSWE